MEEMVVCCRQPKVSESVKAAFVQYRILTFLFYEKHKFKCMQPWEACILCLFSTSSSVTIIEIVCFTVVYLVAKPLNWSEVKGDLVMIQMSLLHNKVTFSLTPNQGVATKYATVKWPVPIHVLTTILIFAFQSFWFKLRSRSPCCLSNVQFDIEIPEDDNIQVTLI